MSRFQEIQTDHPFPIPKDSTRHFTHWELHVEFFCLMRYSHTSTPQSAVLTLDHSGDTMFCSRDSFSPAPLASDPAPRAARGGGEERRWGGSCPSHAFSECLREPRGRRPASRAATLEGLGWGSRQPPRERHGTDRASRRAAGGSGPCALCLARAA